MDKKIIISVIFASLIILLLGGILVSSYQKKTKKETLAVKEPSKNSFIYYYGITCPHCQELNQWMKENKIEEKLSEKNIKFEKKEVYNNQNNSLEMEKAAKICRLDSTFLGVPFLYDAGQCYIGTDKIESVLLEKIKK